MHSCVFKTMFMMFAASAAMGGTIQKPFPPMIREIGTRTYTRTDGSVTIKKLFVITLGDTAEQDELSVKRGDVYIGIFAPFVLDAAQYFPNNDGTWQVLNFRPPKSQEDYERFKEYLGRPEVVKFMRDPHGSGDFGEPGDFIFKRTRLLPAELPPPLCRLDPRVLVPFEGIFQFNEDKTVKLELADAFAEDGNAQTVFAILSQALDSVEQQQLSARIFKLELPDQGALESQLR